MGFRWKRPIVPGTRRRVGQSLVGLVEAARGIGVTATIGVRVPHQPTVRGSYDLLRGVSPHLQQPVVIGHVRTTSLRVRGLWTTALQGASYHCESPA